MNNIYEDAELSLLAGILRYPFKVFDVAKYLKPIMFSSRPHYNIYKAMETIANRGIEPSPLLIKNELLLSKVFDESGGDDYLSQLAIFDTNPNNIDEYIKIIETGFKQRELMRIGNEIMLNSAKQDDPDRVITKTIKNLDKLLTDTTTQEIVYLADILDDFFVALKNRQEHPEEIGITTGFEPVDLITTGYQPAEVWLIGGRPSMGKTSLLYSSLLAIAQKGTPVLLVNREMYILNILERLYSSISGVNHLNIRTGRLTPEEFSKLEQAKLVLKEIPFYIDNNWQGDDSYVINSIRRYHYLKGIKVVGLDYIQLLAERSGESTQELGRISRNLKLVSGELEITTLILSQLNREVEKRDDKRPLMSDLRQSGNLEEDADYMIALYRDEVYTANSKRAGILEFIIRKARNGPCTTLDLYFDGATVSVRSAKPSFEYVKKGRHG